MFLKRLTVFLQQALLSPTSFEGAGELDPWLLQVERLMVLLVDFSAPYHRIFI